ncbi:hypothetical protein PF008_g31534 [Phytophthora fragariae]|uniref:Uncharacterized protein n=1 Tax=Phytophthora fragariae TaxID=53985 RepID=A0A6G0Q2D2_9STRA|nr:hypothetical protein PF003_g6919 [Phytophthora fragariae]KAE9266776.1 hypothetical protein PF008_g31534 [Phytophthora fragariae]
MQPVLRATLVSAESLVASEQFVRVEIVQYVLLVGLVSVKIFVPVELPVGGAAHGVGAVRVGGEVLVSGCRSCPYAFRAGGAVVGMGPLVSLDLVKSGLTVAPPVSTERFLSKEPPVSVGFV